MKIQKEHVVAVRELAMAAKEKNVLKQQELEMKSLQMLLRTPEEIPEHAQEAFKIWSESYTSELKHKRVKTLHKGKEPVHVSDEE